MALLRGTTIFLVCAALFSLTLPVPMALAGDPSSGSDEAKRADAEAAFNSAKELGTAEAWNAFLSNYPTGFHADLARAYLKKVTDQPAAASPASPGSFIAHELSCSERKKLRSLNSDVATKVTFVNTSGSYRSIQWIDFEGNLKDYGGLNPGEQRTQDTFVTHPWMIATGPRDCLQIFMPAAGPATVELPRRAADDTSPPEAKKKEAAPAKKEKQPGKQTQKKSTLVCAKNYKLSKGECVLIQNCGANAYRSAEGDCYCNKNYVMSSGKCVWKQDKQGFEVAPWKKAGCKTWQKQCSQGNNKACRQYEANCQVN
jgi:hypothetical protein